MKTNTVYNINFLDNTLPDGCAGLIIADPPYFEVKGEFDFIWPSFDDYLKDVDKWARECSRLLADNGTLLWWGNCKKIAYSQIVLDKYLSLCNSLVWEKIDSMQYQYYSPALARTFNTHNERLLMYEKGGDDLTGLELIMEKHIKPRHPFAKYLTTEFKRAGVKRKEIAALFPSKNGNLTGCVSNWLNGDNVMTKDQYLKVRQYLNGEYLRKEYEYLRKEYEYLRKEYEDLRKEYEDLRKEYEDLRRPFNNTHKLTDVLKFSQESHITRKYKHPTQKPLSLTRRLMQTCTRAGQLVVVPFAGSGTECEAAVLEKLEFIGFDIDEKHCKTANDRVQKHFNNPTLF